MQKLNKINISFIIPAYNAEDYLPRCLDSIFSQSFEDSFEVIVVDDCSTDNTLKIAQKYAEKYEEVRIVKHDVNKNVAEARNTGLKEVKGEYIWFVDSDDSLPENSLNKFYAEMIKGEYDILIGDYISIERNSMVLVTQMPPISKSEIIYSLFTGKIHGGLCNKLLKRTYCENQNLAFPTAVKVREDMYGLLLLLSGNVKIGYLNEAVYNYFQHEASITKKVQVGFADKHIKSVEYIASLIASNFSELDIDTNILKLSVRKDLMLHHIRNFSIRNLYPETNKDVMSAEFIPFWVRIAMLSEIYGFGVIKQLLFSVRKLLK